MTRRTASDNPKPLFDRAAKKALAEEHATEGAKAMSEYKAEGEAEHTAPLQVLRLAKEETDKAAITRSRRTPRSER